MASQQSALQAHFIDTHAACRWIGDRALVTVLITLPTFTPGAGCGAADVGEAGLSAGFASVVLDPSNLSLTGPSLISALALPRQRKKSTRITAAGMGDEHEDDEDNDDDERFEVHRARLLGDGVAA